LYEIVSEISQETDLPPTDTERARRDAEPADPLTNFFRTLVILTPGWTFGLFDKALAPALYPTQNRTTREAHQEPQLSRGQPRDIPTVPSWIFTINELLHPSINATLYSETEPARTIPDPSLVTPETTEMESFTNDLIIIFGILSVLLGLLILLRITSRNDDYEIPYTIKH